MIGVSIWSGFALKSLYGLHTRSPTILDGYSPSASNVMASALTRYLQRPSSNFSTLR